LRFWQGYGRLVDPSPSDVDYRFLLANERTFLAWMRTALGLIAGGVALDQFVRVEQGEGLVVLVALVTITAGALVAILGTVRWARTDAAMRAGRPLGRSPMLIIVGSLVAALAVVIALILAFA
jgi:putative membrane protein